jgi:lipoic acid synthetase
MKQDLPIVNNDMNKPQRPEGKERSKTVNRKPDWLKVQLNTTENYRFLKKLVKSERLNTVCEEAKCPNIHECWGNHRTATFMILGDTCTRRCRFCNVKTGLPRELDLEEPVRVAESVKEMGLEHVVITMVNRDDLKDGGASILAATVTTIQKMAPKTSVEVLSSDLMGDFESIKRVVDAKPSIVSHNLETVRRLTPQIRSRSDYDRSLRFLELAKEIDPQALTKSSIMLGLGETKEEIIELMDDLLAVGVTLMNMGQYLQPSRQHIPVVKYWKPEEFDELKAIALEKGFSSVEAAPLVRSSYHAGEQYEEYRKKIHPLYQDN